MVVSMDLSRLADLSSAFMAVTWVISAGSSLRYSGPYTRLPFLYVLASGALATALFYLAHAGASSGRGLISTLSLAFLQLNLFAGGFSYFFLHGKSRALWRHCFKAIFALATLTLFTLILNLATVS